MVASRRAIARNVFKKAVPFGLLALCVTAGAAQQNPVEFIDPLIGTDGHGHAFPGSSVPFGMVQLSPDTRIDTWDGCSGYHYTDSSILGFSHTHLSGTGCGGLGDILVMPSVKQDVLKSGYTSAFSHSKEVAKAGYYKVFLDTPGVTAELTSTSRTGFHRYTFPASKTSSIVLDLSHGVQNDVIDTQLKVENKTTLSGFRKSSGWGGERFVYYVLQFSKPFKSAWVEPTSGTVHGSLTEGSETGELSGKLKSAFHFETKAGEQILVKVGISATSVEGARKNLKAENPGWNFDNVRKAAEKQWSKCVDAIKVDSSDVKLKRTFYTNLYLSYIAPNLFSDVDGSYMGLDHKVHPKAGFQNYSTFSLWDTYRALHPLMTVLNPGEVSNMVQSLITEHKESGYHSTPIWPLWGNETWCMIGYHSVPVIVDAYFKGFKGFDPEEAYQAIRDTAMQDRDGLDTYKKLGYVASRAGFQATSKTIEFAYDDWCIARMAEALGHKEDAELFYKRSTNYRNHFDRSTQFFRGRKANGAWRGSFDTRGLVGDEYTEADAWQYMFGVQQDVPGLISLYGGDEGFIKRMDQMFEEDSTIHTNIPDITGLIGQYSQGDEQCHHVAYLYNYAGAPWKSQRRIRQSMDLFFNDTPAGQCGNIDCGQMAAWYVFSSMGFYPVNPASGIYIIGSPRFDKAVLDLDKSKYGGRKFTVIAENNSRTNIYIQSATFNGKPYDKSWISHKQLTEGGTLKFVMGPQPNKAWGASLESRPPTTMPAGYQYSPLPEPAEDKPVVLTLPIRIVCGSDEPVGDFIPDPNMMEGSTSRGNMKVDTSAPNSGPEEIYKSERYAQDFSYKFSVPKGKGYTVRLHFAEVFDDSPDMRIEDVFLNGKIILKDFDIFKAAGGSKKAVVREYKDVQPDANGMIIIRIKATPGSPDQNAKISGIEILD